MAAQGRAGRRRAPPAGVRGARLHRSVRGALIDAALIAALRRAARAAAMAAGRHAGRGDPHAVDAASVDALRQGLASAPMRGTVVIGEGARDRAPELAPGERIGRWHPADPALDVAVDPVECTRACAEGRPGAFVALAVGERLCGAPDVWMDKRAVGPRGAGALVAGRPLADDLQAVAQRFGRPVSALRVGVLDRPRNDPHVEVLRAHGIEPVRVRDGDLGPMLALGSRLDLFVGLGGAPEGVLAAVGLGARGGQVVGIVDGRALAHGDLVRGRAGLMVAGITPGRPAPIGRTRWWGVV